MLIVKAIVSLLFLISQALIRSKKTKETLGKHWAIRLISGLTGMTIVINNLMIYEYEVAERAVSTLWNGDHSALAILDAVWIALFWLTLVFTFFTSLRYLLKGGKA